MPQPRSCFDSAMLRNLIGGFDRAAAIVACALVVALLVCVALGVVTRGLGDDDTGRLPFGWAARGPLWARGEGEV